MQVIKANAQYQGKNRGAVKIVAIDTAEELPENVSSFLPGSIAWCINSGDVYALNSSGEWKQQSNIIITL